MLPYNFVDNVNIFIFVSWITADTIKIVFQISYEAYETHGTILGYSNPLAFFLSRFIPHSQYKWVTPNRDLLLGRCRNNSFFEKRLFSDTRREQRISIQASQPSSVQISLRYGFFRSFSTWSFINLSNSDIRSVRRYKRVFFSTYKNYHHPSRAKRF